MDSIPDKYSFIYDIPRIEGQFYMVGNGQDPFTRLKDMEEFMSTVLHTGRIPYDETESRLTWSMWQERLPVWYTQRDPELQYNPFLELFFNEYEKHPVSAYKGIGKITETGILEMRSFVQHLRTKAMEHNTRYEMKKWRNLLTQQVKSVDSLTDEVFNALKHKKVTILRMDLGLNRSLSKTWQDTHIQKWFLKKVPCNPYQKDPERFVNKEDVMLVWDAYLRSIRTSPLFEGNVGYCYRLCYNSIGGYRILLTLFYESEMTKPQQLQRINHLGSRWMELCDGYYSSWNDNTNYLFCTGVIDCNDDHYTLTATEMLKNQNRYDRYFRPKNADKTKLFVRSHLKT